MSGISLKVSTCVTGGWRICAQSAVAKTAHAACAQGGELRGGVRAGSLACVTDGASGFANAGTLEGKSAGGKARHLVRVLAAEAERVGDGYDVILQSRHRRLLLAVQLAQLLLLVGRRCHVGSVATVCHGLRCRPASRCRAQGKGTSANAQERSWGESARGAHGVVARLDQVLALRRRLQADARAHELLQLFKVGGRLAEGRRVGLIDQLAAAVACRPVAARVGVEGGSQRGRSV